MNAPAQSSKPKLTLIISGLGNVPGKKNSKMMIPRKGNQRPMLITKPEIQQWIKRCESSLESQLHSAFQTAAAATSPIARKQSWIASSTPEDDCWECVPVIVLSGDKGEPGCTITIEPIN